MLSILEKYVSIGYFSIGILLWILLNIEIELLKRDQSSSTNIIGLVTINKILKHINKKTNKYEIFITNKLITKFAPFNMCASI